MILTANLFIKKKMQTEDDIRKYVSDIATYVPYVDKLIIYNMTKEDLTPFLKSIARYQNIDYAECEDLGEVTNYKRAMIQAQKENIKEDADETLVTE